MLHQHSCQTDERWADVDAKTACTYQSDHIRRCPNRQMPTHRSLQTADWTVKRVEHAGLCPSIIFPKHQQLMFLYSGMKDRWKRFGNLWRHVYFYLIVLWFIHDCLYQFPQQIHWCLVTTLLLYQILCLFLLSQSISSYSKCCHNILSGTIWTTIIRQMQKKTSFSALLMDSYCLHDWH